MLRRHQAARQRLVRRTHNRLDLGALWTRSMWALAGLGFWKIVTTQRKYFVILVPTPTRHCSDQQVRGAMVNTIRDVLFLIVDICSTNANGNGWDMVEMVNDLVVDCHMLAIVFHFGHSTSSCGKKNNFEIKWNTHAHEKLVRLIKMFKEYWLQEIVSPLQEQEV